MKRINLVIALLAALLAPAYARAVSAPTGLTTGAWVNATMPLYWDNDPVASSWYIYVDGKVFAKPVASTTGLVGAKRFYLLQPLSPAPSYVITMRALAVGQPMSAESAALTATGQTVPVTYVMTPPGQALSVSGGAGGGGGDASAANQVIGNASLAVIAGAITSTPAVNIGGSYIGVSVVAGAAGISVTASQGSPWTVSGSVSVTNLTGVTVNTHAVTQGSPWTVSGSVAVTSLPSSYQGVSIVADSTTRFYGVSVVAGVAGISVTASQSGTWNLGTAGNVSLNAGTATIGSIANISGTISLPTGASTAANQSTMLGMLTSTSNAASMPVRLTYTPDIKNTVPLQVLSWLGITNTAGVSAIQYASITFTATGGSANGITIASAVSGKTIAVIAYTLSTDTAARLTLHHQGGAAVRSNTASNIIGGGLFPVNGGESKEGIVKPGLAQNQPVCLDVSAAVTNLECAVAYITY